MHGHTGTMHGMQTASDLSSVLVEHNICKSVVYSLSWDGAKYGELLSNVATQQDTKSCWILFTYNS